MCSYTKDTYRPVDRHICLGRSPRVYSRRKVSIHSTKCREDRPAYPRETRRKYAGPFAGIVTLVPVAKPSSLATLHQSERWYQNEGSLPKGAHKINSQTTR